MARAAPLPQNRQGVILKRDLFTILGLSCTGQERAHEGRQRCGGEGEVKSRFLCTHDLIR